MKLVFPVLGLCLTLAACGIPGQPMVVDTAVLPAGALGGGFDPDVTAVNQAQYAFADSGRTYGRTLISARAAISMEYISGALNSSPRWDRISALTKAELLQGRAELRAALGVAPGATSQQVVDGLVAAETALSANDQAAASRALTTPTFPEGGQKVLATLNNMPYLRMANVSTMHAAGELFDSSTTDYY